MAEGMIYGTPLSVLDVSKLPSVQFGTKSLTWCGIIGMMAIEGMFFVLTIASYFYLHSRSVEWTPSMLSTAALRADGGETLGFLVGVVVLIGQRTRETAEAREALVNELKKIKGLEVRVVEAGQADGETDGTRLFGALSSALSDVPVDRVAGAFLITDGRVHDIPANAAALAV